MLALEAAKSAGALQAGSVAEVGERCEKVITMLPSTPHVEETVLGPGGLLASRPSDSPFLLIDCSTICPKASRALHEAVSHQRARGWGMLDAPVSGGVGGALAGTLTFMVGCASEVHLEEARPLLLSMGSKVVHCGGPGTGQVAKLCNNLSLAISMIGTAEAFNLGEKLGIDPKVLAGVVNSSTGRCWASDTYNPCPRVAMEGAPAARGFTGGFTNALMEKDLALAMQAARESGSPLPLGSAAHAIYSLLKTNGKSDLDFSSVYLFLSGQEPRK
eukprot:CAMPEP_0172582460 /NCGR_PEP_ID=MMETSP1068-20121228/1866_1 /TAXON_ID=35684 /ORGANISM="Pseudopedinella elastica, Strain CCMP716" /LENGTH=273 /DNA_ID=CAMNT_0013375815 /DNA_START=306 /DNA_END=1127 /DNA_ORIENTATION=-